MRTLTPLGPTRLVQSEPCSPARYGVDWWWWNGAYSFIGDSTSLDTHVTVGRPKTAQTMQIMQTASNY